MGQGNFLRPGSLDQIERLILHPGWMIGTGYKWLQYRIARTNTQFAGCC
jgi:hypothetical protein